MFTNLTQTWKYLNQYSDNMDSKEESNSKHDTGLQTDTTTNTDYTQAGDNSSLGSPLVTSQPREVIRPSIDLNDDMALKIAKDHKKWNRRLKVLFCCLGYKKNKVKYRFSTITFKMRWLYP